VAAGVETLLSEADHRIPVRINPESSEVVARRGIRRFAALVDLVLTNGGQVVIVPNE
jgi:hypothetical protein